MTTPDERRAIIIEQSAVAMKAARDRELAFRRAEAAEEAAEMFRTAAGFLWASLNAVLDDYQHKAHITDSVLEQALVALEWTPEQEGEAE
jgi:hypothetical protein